MKHQNYDTWVAVFMLMFSVCIMVIAVILAVNVASEKRALARLHETQHIAADIKLRRINKELHYHEMYMRALTTEIKRLRQ